MAAHIFAVGERVGLNAPIRYVKDSVEIFVVKSCLPHLGTQLQYRIKAEAEPYDRVVTEGQLSRLNDRTGDSGSASSADLVD